MTKRIMRGELCALCAALVLMAACATQTATSSARLATGGDSAAEKLGWRLGTQSYTFRNVTFLEAVDKTASLGLHYIEAFPNQKVGKERADMKLAFTMPKEVRDAIKRKLKDAGVKMVNYGVITVKGEEQWRQLFDFAKDMGIETIVSEPRAEDFDLLDKLTEEYGINIAIHNHPKPSTYWNPDTVLEACKGHGKRIGACADTGHWMRSGVNPIEALKKLEGRIVSLHLKDLNEFGDRKAHDVPWGTGKGDVKAMLAELRRQNFRGVFAIEYERLGENMMPEIAQCVAYFNRAVAQLL